MLTPSTRTVSAEEGYDVEGSLLLLRSSSPDSVGPAVPFSRNPAMRVTSQGVWARVQFR